MLDITITSSSLGFDAYKEDEKDYAVRNCVRAVIYKSDGTIAVSKEKFEHMNEFYCLPGGGIDEGESEKEGLVREIREELGCTITNPVKVGVVKAVKGYNRRTTYHNVYTAQFEHDLGNIELTEHEKTYVIEIIWTDINTALSLMHRCLEKCEYEKGKFILVRDIEILNYIKSNISLP